MKTEIYKNSIGNAPEILRDGGLVAVPTETVYGLACNGLNESSVKRIYDVKGRPEIKPLSLMVPGPDSIGKYCLEVPEAALALADKFWPGPLTIILKSKDFIPSIVRAGGATVGLRCPDSELTLQCLNEAQVPFAAPSANPSGSPSPKSADEVLEYFDGSIEAIIDGGPCELGFESTIIDLSDKPFKIVRKGALDPEDVVDAVVDSMRVIGITGPSGSGKSSVYNALNDDWLVIDCDKVYHELLVNNAEMLKDIQNSFPESFAGGILDRKILAEIVFNNQERLSCLNDITHKYVIDEVRSRVRNFAMNGGKLVAIDAVELISSGLGNMCDLTVAVIADIKTRIFRIMERDCISEDQAEQRVYAQRSDDYYRKNCDITIDNNSTMDDFLIRFNREVINYGSK